MIMINNNQSRKKKDFLKIHSKSYCGMYRTPEITILKPGRMLFFFFFPFLFN